MKHRNRERVKQVVAVRFNTDELAELDALCQLLTNEKVDRGYRHARTTTRSEALREAVRRALAA